MTGQETDIVIVGAGPVGLMCAYLGKLCGLRTVVIDKSDGPLERGRADALNARTLQLFELVDLFDELYPLGKTCNTSSVWANGKFISRRSAWWEELEGCFHKHFLMLGQSHVENLLDDRLKIAGSAVVRSTAVKNTEITANGCLTTLANGERIRSSYVIGADGSHSFVRDHFKVPFEIVRPQLVWAVIDGVIETDFPKVPEIIVFQSETSDVAWIPREGKLDRFYVRMDANDFTFEEAIAKINRAMSPHLLSFKEIAWHSRFSVKESVAEKFFVQDRIFLAGDACHIHSVNGGQGLNTGLADAFNLMWKLNMVLRFGFSTELLRSYEDERKPVAQSVIETSGELVRSTKYSRSGTHAQDYVEIVRKRAGNITGMGIRYGEEGLRGSRLFDLEVYDGDVKTRLYSLLNYTQFTLLVFGERKPDLELPDFVKVIQIFPKKFRKNYWAESSPYANQAVLVRPDSYIESSTSLDNGSPFFLPQFYSSNVEQYS
jgi:2-polyprenyl-6-methoxyphenol hydroxylase-like FAD-dependent oxidoreductase